MAEPFRKRSLFLLFLCAKTTLKRYFLLIFASLTGPAKSFFAFAVLLSPSVALPAFDPIHSPAKTLEVLRSFQEDITRCGDVEKKLGTPSFKLEATDGISYEYRRIYVSRLRNWTVLSQLGKPHKNVAFNDGDEQTETILLFFDSACLFRNFLFFTTLRDSSL